MNLEKLTKEDILHMARADLYYIIEANRKFKERGLEINFETEIEIEAIKNLSFYNDYDDDFVNEYIKDKEIKELYYKLKKVINIIK